LKEKSKLKEYFWRLLFLAIIIFFLWYFFPTFFIKNMKPILSTANFKKFSHSRIQWQQLSEGLEIGDILWKNKQTGFSTTIFLLRVNLDFFSLRVLYNKLLTTAKEIAASEGAAAAINASFFDPNGRPLGLIVQNRKIVQPLPRLSMKNSGIFCLKYARPQILHRNAFASEGVVEAIQSFPRLINHGQPIKDIKNDSEITRRSGVAVDYRGRLIFYITDTQLSGISFSELQNFLMMPELNVKSALNLDGGRSSQLYIDFNNYSKEISGLSEVPVFLGIFSK